MSGFYNPLLHLKRQFSGEVGTISITEKDGEYEVWFEDFNIIGQGSTILDAMDDALDYAVDLANLINQARKKMREPVLTEEESQLIIGAIPLQALSED